MRAGVRMCTWEVVLDCMCLGHMCWGVKRAEGPSGGKILSRSLLCPCPFLPLPPSVSPWLTVPPPTQDGTKTHTGHLLSQDRTKTHTGPCHCIQVLLSALRTSKTQLVPVITFRTSPRFSPAPCPPNTGGYSQCQGRGDTGEACVVRV